MKRLVIVGSVLLAVMAFAIAAEEKKSTEHSAGKGMTMAAGEHHVFAPGDLKWGDGPPSLPAGVKMAVLDGDPGKPGSFTVRLKMPAGYKIPPHTHPTVERVTVISGEPHVAMGDKLDESASKALEVGTYLVLPKNMSHYAWAAAESVVQVQSEGPFQITYVNPADDPRKAKQ